MSEGLEPQGLPRIQYERTYILVPEYTSEDVMCQLVKAVWDKGLRVKGKKIRGHPTLGHSADDAGIGDLDVRRVFAIDAPNIGTGLTQAWFDEWYPETKLILTEWSDFGIEYLPEAPPPPPPGGEGALLVGMHDENWILHARGRGAERSCCVVPIYLSGDNPNSLGGVPDLRHLEQYCREGIQVIGRLCFSHAQGGGPGEGGWGSMPAEALWEPFGDLMARVIRWYPDIWWVIGNEMNSDRERPWGYPAGSALEPAKYVGFYNYVVSQVGEDYVVGPGAIDYMNTGWGDWRVTHGNVLQELDRIGVYPIHAYDRGRGANREDVFGYALQGCFQNFNTVRQQLAILPWKFQDARIAITECSHLFKLDGSYGWDNIDGAIDKWIGTTLKDAHSWGVDVIAFYRWGWDDWTIADKGHVLDAITKAAGGT